MRDHSSLLERPSGGEDEIVYYDMLGSPEPWTPDQTAEIDLLGRNTHPALRKLSADFIANQSISLAENETILQDQQKEWATSNIFFEFGSQNRDLVDVEGKVDVNALVKRLGESGDSNSLNSHLEIFLDAGADPLVHIGAKMSAANMEGTNVEVEAGLVMKNLGIYLDAGADPNQIMELVSKAVSPELLQKYLGLFFDAGADQIYITNLAIETDNFDFLFSHLDTLAKLGYVEDPTQIVDQALSQITPISYEEDLQTEDVTPYLLARHWKHLMSAGVPTDRVLYELIEKGYIYSTGSILQNDENLIASDVINKVIERGTQKSMISAYHLKDYFWSSPEDFKIQELADGLLRANRYSELLEVLEEWSDWDINIDLGRLKDGLFSQPNNDGEWKVFSLLEHFEPVLNQTDILRILSAIDLDNLREIQSINDKRKREVIQKILASNSTYRRFIQSFGQTKTPLSVHLYTKVYLPLIEGSEDGIASLRELALDLGIDSAELLKLNPDEAYTKIEVKTRQIISALLGGDLQDMEELRLSNPDIGNMILNKLRAKRGGWAIEHLNAFDLEDMVDVDTVNRANLRWEVQNYKVEKLAPELMAQADPAPTNEAIDEADLICEAIASAYSRSNQDDDSDAMQFITKAMALSVEELRKAADTITKSTKTFPEGARERQLEVIQGKISNLVDEEGATLVPNLGTIGDVIKIVNSLSGSNSDPVGRSIRLDLLSFLYYPVIAKGLPDNIKELAYRGNQRLSPSRSPGPKYSSSDMRTLEEYVRHAIADEWWGKATETSQKDIRQSFRNSLKTRSIQDNIKAWDKLIVARTALSKSKDRKREFTNIKIVRSNSKLLRTTAGAMGDACYSQFGSIVPEEDDVCVILDENDNIAGSFLLLRGRDIKGNHLLMIRALNPLDSLLKKVDADSLTDIIFKVTKDLAETEGAQAVIVVDQVSNAATTNRPAILELVKQKTDGKKKILSKDRRLVFNNYESTLERIKPI